jgi:hypothetical protein
MPIDGPAPTPTVLASVLAASGGRIGSTTAILVALTGLALGGRALARREATTVPLGLGLAAVAVGAVVVATADGELGSGNGRGGAYVAVALGLAALALGAVTRARARRPA